MQRLHVIWGLAICSAIAGMDLSRTCAAGQSDAIPVVEVEDDVYGYTAADNGAGPMWCHGSTYLMRVGERVFASGLETLPDVKPMNNCRWMLFARGANGWELQQVDARHRTREPSPLAALPDGRVLLSVNPTLVEDPNVPGGPARPELLAFRAADPKAPFETILPVWEGQPRFTEHSYRSLAADGQTGAFILFQNVGYTHAAWTFRDGAGRWSAHGKLVWPWGADYETPEPIRVCYPNVAVKGRAVHFCGVSDIVEPNRTWREYKQKLTGQKWDYDFRRLFYTWTDDITSGKFAPWVEIASREKTCGWISPGDLWLAPDGTVHILWTERALDERLREKFFPHEKQARLLQYAVLHAGKVIRRQTLLAAVEGESQEVAQWARLHAAPDGRLYAFYYVSGVDMAGKPVSENRLRELRLDGTCGPEKRVPLQHPISHFFTATVRAGSLPSNILDVLGSRADAQNKISYARIRLP